MGTSPAFSFYAKEWLAATLSWSLDLRGAYSTLLAYQWDAGAVPGDDMLALGRLLGVSATKARALWGVISDKFERHEDGWKNARLELERQKQADRAAALAENGAKGGRPPKKATKNQTEKPTETKRFQNEKAEQNQNESLASSFSSSIASVDIPPSGSSPSDGGLAVWDSILKALPISDHSRDNFFKHWRVQGYLPGVRLELNAPSAHVRTWVNQHYAKAITEAVEHVAPGLKISLVYRPLAVAS